jgi:acid phosphatase type 7
MKPLWDALYHAGADVVLNGHDHDYERFAPQDPQGRADAKRGIREFVVGSGGKNSHRTMGGAKANSVVRNDDTFGVLKLTLHAAGYDWEFVPEAGKTFSDSGNGSCH